jgi:aromatic-L-amino-acid decarboxylase
MSSVPGAAPHLEPAGLEPSGDELRQMVAAALDWIVPHLDSLPAQPAADTDVAAAAAVARSLSEPLPQRGAPLDELLRLLFERATPRSFNTAGPGYLAYIPGGGIVHSAVADLIADCVNRFTGVFAAAPALSQLEANVLAWFSEILGFPPQARGVLTSGGSIANFIAVFTARRERLAESFADGILYASDQAHHSVLRAAILAGFPAANVRSVPTDEKFRLRPELLAAEIAADRRAGRKPFLLVANAGTTNTGAVDPLPALVELARREGLWLHVDAAYGGFFLLTEQGRQVMQGIEHADSVVLDPHKGLFLPYGTGALLVRDGAALRRAHAVSAEYLPPMQTDPDLVDFCTLSPELSRPFRGLRVWLPFKLLGVSAFRSALEEKLTLTQMALAAIRRLPGIEVLAEPELSLFAFRLRPPGFPAADLNRLNRELLGRVNARNRVHMTGTLLVCVLSFRTHADRIQAAIDDLASSIAELTARSASPALD